ncbi:MAG: M23 family metallopeptidase [Chitinophagaceae bacterium]|jgi:hypothetical protein
MRLVILLLLITSSAFAQNNTYPQQYFRNPLNIPIMLAGNFGECRPGHFHSGIDIKTEGKENLPVFAAADGYISRVKMEPGGFGHGVYITHPNGYTTLYAHLNNFFPALQKLVHQSQYEKKNWELDLSFSPEKFPVKKGQQIAWSGNTGGSTAPHLHFEIRDNKTEHPLNPQLFGFEILDKIPPKMNELALYNAEESIYEQKALRFKLSGKNNEFIPLKDTIVCPYLTVNIGLATDDFMNQSENTLSFYKAEWYLDDTLHGRLLLDDIGYDETRYLNACADYKTKQETGLWFNSLFLLPNNKLSRIYNDLKNENGSLSLRENALHRIKIVLTDVSGNESVLKVNLLQQGEPAPTSCLQLWKAGLTQMISLPNLKFTLEPLSLYDDVCGDINRLERKSSEGSVSAEFEVHLPEIPVHKYFDISLKPELAIPFSLNNKIAIRYSDGKTKSGRVAKLNNGWYTASVRSFGNYQLVIDTTGPQITPLVKSGMILGKRKELRFIVKDNLTTVRKFTGTINGQWVCIEQHSNFWFYTVDEYCPKGKNKLLLAATDENDNERQLEYIFIR